MVSSSGMSMIGSTGDGWDDDYMYQSYVHPTSPNPEMIRCEHCGVKNKRNEPYCTACGVWLPDKTTERHQENGRVVYTEHEEPEGLIARIKAMFGK